MRRKALEARGGALVASQSLVNMAQKAGEAPRSRIALAQAEHKRHVQLRALLDADVDLVNRRVRAVEESIAHLEEAEAEQLRSLLPK
jgi:hypothetical protein